MRYVQVFFGLFAVLIGVALAILSAIWLIWVSPVVEPLSVIFGGIALIIAGGVTIAHWQQPVFRSIAWTVGIVTGISTLLLWVRYGGGR